MLLLFVRDGFKGLRQATHKESTGSSTHVSPGGSKPLINQPFPPEKKNCFGLCPPPSSFCHPSHPSAKPSTSINLPRNTIIATPLPFSHSSLSGLLSHGASCVCWAPMLESHNPYRGIRLPFSRAWRLEVGKHQV